MGWKYAGNISSDGNVDQKLMSDYRGLWNIQEEVVDIFAEK